MLTDKHIPLLVDIMTIWHVIGCDVEEYCDENFHAISYCVEHMAVNGHKRTIDLFKELMTEHGYSGAIKLISKEVRVI